MTPEPPRLGCFYVYLSNRCNCRCRHCWIMSDSPPRPVSESFLDPALFDHAIREALPLGLSRVKYTGGEPTLHPEFLAILKVASGHGVSSSMETNGLIVDADMAAALAAHGCKSVSVSMDAACADVHDRIRGVDGAFDRTLRGIRCLREQPMRLQIILTLMRANVGEVEALLALAERLGADSVKLNLLQPTLRGEALFSAGEALPVGEILDLERRLREGRIDRHGRQVSLDVPMAFRSIRALMQGRNSGTCGIMGILGLLAGGRYGLCGIGENVPELAFGRIGIDDLRHLWATHPVLQEIRTGLPARLEGICGRCVMNRLCLGACVAQNFYRSGDLFHAHWFCESAALLDLFPGTRIPPQR